MSKNTKSTIAWKVSTVVVSCLLAAVSTCYALGVGWKQSARSDKPSQSQTSEDALSLWTEKAEAKQKLVSYMNAITDKNGADYVLQSANFQRTKEKPQTKRSFALLPAAIIPVTTACAKMK